MSSARCRCRVHWSVAHITRPSASCSSKLNAVPEWDRIGFTRRPPLMSNISRILSAIDHGDTRPRRGRSTAGPAPDARSARREQWTRAFPGPTPKGRTFFSRAGCAFLGESADLNCRSPSNVGRRLLSQQDRDVSGNSRFHGSLAPVSGLGRAEAKLASIGPIHPINPHDPPRPPRQEPRSGDPNVRTTGIIERKKEKRLQSGKRTPPADSWVTLASDSWKAGSSS
jgi:hypothetical protein